MDDRTLRILEWDKIIGKVMEFSHTSLGKEYVSEIRPLMDKDLAEIRLRETAEAKRLARAGGGAPFGGIRDIRSAVKRCRLGSTVDSKELSDIQNTLRGEARLRKFFLDSGDSLVYLAEYAKDLGGFRPLEEELGRCLTDEGEVADAASPALAKLRSQLRTFQNRIRDKVESILRSSDNQKYFQDPLITIRNDRFVIPVKAECRGSVPGIVHDQSASGATVFIEPMIVVEMNNQMRQLEAAERDEVTRILTVLSGLVGDQGQEILTAVEIMAYLDMTFAKAGYAESIRANEPELNDHGLIDIKRARHPLLKGNVVAIDVNLGNKFNTLVITGPNTGGKTVTLKTTGLLTLMAQAGLHIPADMGSRIAVFDDVFSDIGDEQSIEQSLSTFSSHMVHIVRILGEATANSLILLDELGAGTDPTEGAALAMAILELLHEKGMRTIATTHYSELKTFAYSRPGVENASVEFDVETLKPTYRLLIGVPGSSNAFFISEKLGLSRDVVERAKSFLTQEDLKIETLIQNIEQDQRNAEENRVQTQRLRMDQDVLKKQYEDQIDKIKKDKAGIIKKAHEEAKALLEETKKQCESMIAIIREAGQEGSLRDAARMVRDEIGNSTRSHDEKLKGMQPKKPFKPRRPLDNVILGQQVYINSLEQRGSILTTPNASGEVSVQIGIMKMNVNIKDLEKVDEKAVSTAISPRKTSNTAEVGRGKASTVTTELDLRGLMVEEALERTDKYIDDTALAGVGMVRIIHGKGTGALRTAIRDMLNGHPNIKAYRYGESGEGGDGVTVVTLKD